MWVRSRATAGLPADTAAHNCCGCTGAQGLSSLVLLNQHADVNTLLTSGKLPSLLQAVVHPEDLRGGFQKRIVRPILPGRAASSQGDPTVWVYDMPGQQLPYSRETGVLWWSTSFWMPTLLPCPVVHRFPCAEHAQCNTQQAAYTCTFACACAARSFCSCISSGAACCNMDSCYINCASLANRALD
jgi:hypothetical protein